MKVHHSYIKELYARENNLLNHKIDCLFANHQISPSGTYYDIPDNLYMEIENYMRDRIFY